MESRSDKEESRKQQLQGSEPFAVSPTAVEIARWPHRGRGIHSLQTSFIAHSGAFPSVFSICWPRNEILPRAIWIFRHHLGNGHRPKRLTEKKPDNGLGPHRQVFIRGLALRCSDSTKARCPTPLFTPPTGHLSPPPASTTTRTTECPIPTPLPSFPCSLVPCLLDLY